VHNRVLAAIRAHKAFSRLIFFGSFRFWLVDVFDAVPIGFATCDV
jgi:hypothetical protein